MTDTRTIVAVWSLKFKLILMLLFPVCDQLKFCWDFQWRKVFYFIQELLLNEDLIKVSELELDLEG